MTIMFYSEENYKVLSNTITKYFLNVYSSAVLLEWVG